MTVIWQLHTHSGYITSVIQVFSYNVAAEQLSSTRLLAYTQTVKTLQFDRAPGRAETLH